MKCPHVGRIDRWLTQDFRGCSEDMEGIPQKIQTFEHYAWDVLFYCLCLLLDQQMVCCHLQEIYPPPPHPPMVGTMAGSGFMPPPPTPHTPL